MSPNSNGSGSANGSSSHSIQGATTCTLEGTTTLPDASRSKVESNHHVTTRKPNDDDDDDDEPSSSSSKMPTLSSSMIACVCYFMHGMVNSLLLSPWCPARASFWNVTQSNPGQDWMLRWLSLTILQVHLLLAVWALTAIGNVILEQRVVALTSALLVASLTAGVSFVPHLNPAMAALQAVIYVSLLAVLWWDQTNWNSISTRRGGGGGPAQATPAALFLGMNNHNSNHASAVQAWRSSSFDARRRLPLATVATVLLSVVQWLRVVDLTLGRGRATYVHHTRYMHDAVFTSIADMAYQHMLFVAVLLTASVVGALASQQKLLLRANTGVLLLTLWMLAGAQGEDMELAARRAGVVGTFAAIVVSVVGSL